MRVANMIGYKDFESQFFRSETFFNKNWECSNTLGFI